MQAAMLLPEQAVESALELEVLRGLMAYPKHLSPWLFYDAAGSALFEKITELDEYYVTRTERAILQAHAEQILATAAAPLAPGDAAATLEVLELGAGTATKTGLLLRALAQRQTTVRYVPIDVSASALAEARRRLLEEIGGLEIDPLVGDYSDGFAKLFGPAATSTEGDGGAPLRKLVLYIGSSLGNFEPHDALDLLLDLRQQLSPGDALLLGVDLVKDTQTLLAAYDDAQGVTADFNRNVLVRLNRELGANFDLSRFRHLARWNGPKSRIEMHLQSTEEQIVHLQTLDLSAHFDAGETIHTENSYKFTQEGARHLLDQAGFTTVGQWSDAKSFFGVFLGRVRDK